MSPKPHRGQAPHVFFIAKIHFVSMLFNKQMFIVFIEHGARNCSEATAVNKTDKKIPALRKLS